MLIHELLGILLGEALIMWTGDDRLNFLILWSNPFFKLQKRLARESEQE